MTDYQFMNDSPNNSYYGGGNFHSEGFENENIKVLALYYFDITDNIYGGGCHVAIGKCGSYNIFCRYTDDLIARVDTKNGIFIIAWKG